MLLHLLMHLLKHEKDYIFMAGTWVDGGRQGGGTMTSPRLERVGVASVVGQYEEGVLSGRGKLVMRDGSVREGWFQHGYCHGPFRCPPPAVASS